MGDSEEIAWFRYIFIIIITTFIVSIITEKLVINRLQLSEGVEIKAGRCRLKQGYGPITVQKNDQMI
jgi:hypothetical protein